MATTPTRSWRVLIQPYVKSTQLFACPSNTGNAQTTVDDGGTFMPRSYSINGTDDNIGGQAPTGFSGRSLSSIGSVAQVIYAGETDPDWSFPEIYMTGPARPNTGDTVQHYAFKGHLGTVNFLFVDGHVKAQKPTSTGTPINMWTIEDDGVGPAMLLDRLNAWTEKVNS